MEAAPPPSRMSLRPCPGYTAPKPWGPWASVSSYSSKPQGYYGPQVVMKFASPDNHVLFAVTAGDRNDASYRMTFVPLSWP